MRGARWAAVTVAGLLILVSPGLSMAQAPAPGDRSTPQTPPVPGQPVPVPAPVPTVPGPPTQPAEPVDEDREPAPAPEATAEPGPQPVPEELLPGRATPAAPPFFVGPDLFNPPPHQGWITVTPSFTLSGEYNDNLFQTSRDRTTDGIIGFSPGLTLSMRRPQYSLLAGYNTSGELFLNEDELSGFGNRQQFFADGFYQLSPRLSLSVTDRFLLTGDTNAVTTSGVATARSEGWRNTLTPRLRFQATPSTGLSLTASHTVLRFKFAEDQDSDTYRLRLGMDHRFTQRLSGAFGLGAAYIDFSDEPSVWTYSPTVGFSYAVTPTLRASVNGGPTVTDRDGEDIEITPSFAVSASQTFRFGSVGFGYNRAIVAEAVGLSDRQVIFGSLVFSTLVRGLQLGFLPRYSIVDRDVADRDRKLKALTLTLRGTYQVARSISLIGSYTFFNQTEDRSGPGQDRDIDQNRIFLGVQYAFPISIY